MNCNITNPVAIIIPYFGKFPEWFDFYLYTCGKQHLVDFHYFSDNNIPHKIYPNTFFHSISFEDYCLLASQHLDCNFHPSNPYFLNMLKPFLGCIHKELLAEYIFWGYADIDLIYGELSSLVNEKNLKKYDIITSHVDRLAGHFTIFRNNLKNRELAKKIPNWKDVLTSNTFTSLDESGTLLCIAVPHLVWTMFLYKCIRFIYNHIVKHFFPIHNNSYLLLDLSFQFTQLLHPHVYLREGYTSLEPVEDNPWVYHTSTGRIEPVSREEYGIPRRKSIPYLHFLFFKKNIWKNSDTHWHDDFYHLSPNLFICGGDCPKSN